MRNLVDQTFHLKRDPAYSFQIEIDRGDDAHNLAVRRAGIDIVHLERPLHRVANGTGLRVCISGKLQPPGALRGSLPGSCLV